jgi:cytochrome c553
MSPEDATTFATSGGAAIPRFAREGEGGRCPLVGRQISYWRRSAPEILAGAALSAAAADDKSIYEKDCAKRHGAEGKGDTKMGKKVGRKDYSDAKVQAELKDDAAMKAIKEGVKDKEGKVLMRPAEGVSDSDIKELVSYLRKFKKGVATLTFVRRRRYVVSFCSLANKECDGAGRQQWRSLA